MKFLTMHVIWKGKGSVLPISIILADLEINLAKFSGGKQYKLDYMCFSEQISLTNEPTIWCLRFSAQKRDLVPGRFSAWQI